MIRVTLEDGTILNLAEELGETWAKIKQIEVLAGVEAELTIANGVQKLPVVVQKVAEGNVEVGSEAGIGLVDVEVRGVVLMDPEVGLPVIFAMPTEVAKQIGQALQGPKTVAAATPEELRRFG